jgi:hypothetical protein
MGDVADKFPEFIVACKSEACFPSSISAFKLLTAVVDKIERGDVPVTIKELNCPERVRTPPVVSI